MSVYAESLSELISTCLIDRGPHIREHTTIVPYIATIITNAKSVFSVWIDFGFVELADVLECLVGLQEALSLDAELEQNRRQCSVQSCRIQ